MGDCLPSDTGKSKLTGAVPNEHLISLCHSGLIMLTEGLDQVSPTEAFLFFYPLMPCGWEGGRILSYFSGIIVNASAMR